VCIMLYFWGQSTMVGFIIVGVCIGQAAGEGDKTGSATMVLDHFSEVAILMLLFMAGIEVDITSFLKRWKIVSIMAIGQIVMNTMVGNLVGLVPGIVVEHKNTKPGSHWSGFSNLFFAFCLTFSSTVIVVDYLKSNKVSNSLYGQICLGTILLQDFLAVLCIAVLESIRPASSTEWSDDIGFSIVKMLGLLIVFAGGMFFVSWFILKPLFYRVAHSAELLFAGTLGWQSGSRAWRTRCISLPRLPRSWPESRSASCPTGWRSRTRWSRFGTSA